MLGYVNNEARHFHAYVANRIQKIRDHTSQQQWHCVESKSNPADEYSRRLKANEIRKDSRCWINVPLFLYECVENWSRFNQPEYKIKLRSDYPEIKRSNTFSTSIHEFANLLQRLNYFSQWYQSKRAIAFRLRYRQVLLQSPHEKEDS